ncbi:uncharacterized protein LOC111365694 [Olea europaea var. sylvestris]|uniref:uncharacterized protein LOC111365694 n=1 Tax=Olea europaea var. sylvestris TaxID=158386 RepID=UPI000C1D3C72|nr:uncharacterized protein LOC111365694 [Olea europaea var. sylvestris]
MSKLTNALAVGERVKFSSQAQLNPRRQHLAQTLGSGESNLREINAITNRSGKVIEPILKPKENEKVPDNTEESTPSKEVVKNPSRVPFPQALKSTSKSVGQHNEILEHLKQITPKYKGPGCPIVSCIIGNHEISQVLLDLGASVKIMPGVVEDVLVQVDKFYYPIDFLILDLKVDVNVNSKIPIILGGLLLATANALINCRNGLMKLSFGNMTLDVNNFHIIKQPKEDDECYQTFMINALVQEKAPAIIDREHLNTFLSNSKILAGYDDGEYANICPAFDDL